MGNCAIESCLTLYCGCSEWVLWEGGEEGLPQLTQVLVLLPRIEQVSRPWDLPSSKVGNKASTLSLHGKPNIGQKTSVLSSA